MTRTKVADPPARRRLLDAAERLMLAQGYAGTAVDEICAAAKLTKGSFFHYFSSKEDLGRQLLERFCGRMQQRIQDAVARERDPLKRVYAFLDFSIAMATECQQGCLLGSFAQELSETNREMRAICDQAFGVWGQRLKADLDAAKAKYAPRGGVDTRSLADHVIAVVEGSKILAKAKGDGQVEADSLRHLKRYLQALFGR